MTTLEALLTTACTLERMEDLLTDPCEADLLRAVQLVGKEVRNMVDEEMESPGRYDGMAD